MNCLHGTSPSIRMRATNTILAQYPDSLWHLQILGRGNRRVNLRSADNGKRKPLLDKAMRTNPTFPNWFHGPLVVWHYRKGDYVRAYEEALKYTMPNNFWGPLLRAATLGHLNRAGDARDDLSALLAIRPDFPERAGYLIRLYVKEEELVGQILEGLERAGLEIDKG